MGAPVRYGQPGARKASPARMDVVPPGGVGSRYVIVSGPAASGKSVVAHAIAGELGWPVIAKDTIKAALISVLSPHDLQAAREVGRAAVAVLLVVAAEVRGGVVLDAVWRHDQGRHRLPELSGHVVEVFCRCDRSVLEARYATRVRPAGYVPEYGDPSELWSPETFEPVALGWPVVEVDTTREVDLRAALTAIRRKLDQPGV